MKQDMKSVRAQRTLWNKTWSLYMHKEHYETRHEVCTCTKNIMKQDMKSVRAQRTLWNKTWSLYMHKEHYETRHEVCTCTKNIMKQDMKSVRAQRTLWNKTWSLYVHKETSTLYKNDTRTTRKTIQEIVEKLLPFKSLFFACKRKLSKTSRLLRQAVTGNCPDRLGWVTRSTAKFYLSVSHVIAVVRRAVTQPRRSGQLPVAAWRRRRDVFESFRLQAKKDSWKVTTFPL